jgi:hypothetical protein
MKNLGMQFNTRIAWAIGILLIIQQIIVASSSIWLVSFSKTLTTEPKLIFLALFLLSLVLPYVPGAASYFLLKIFEFKSLENFWKERNALLEGRLDLQGNSDMRDRQLATYVKDGPQLIQDSAVFFYDLTSTSLNVLLNILTVSLLLSGWFVMSYAVSLFIAAAALKILANINAKAAAGTESAKIKLNGILGNFWDNVTIANRLNKSLWIQTQNDCFKTYERQGIRAAALRESSTVILALVAFVPTLITIAFYVFEFRSDSAQLIALTVLLPRIFMILNFTTAVIHQIRDIPIFQARASQLLQAMELTKPTSIADRIQTDLIAIYDNKTDRTMPLSESLPEKGWLTVRGPNGAGKSSWLACLKQTLGERAFYYPARANLTFFSETAALSTGQRARLEIEKILEHSDEPILLLDEWDANLDSVVQTAITNRLQTEGERRLVIDVRH